MLAGELTSVAVVGSEAMYSRLLARREGRDVDWTGAGQSSLQSRHDLQ